MPRSNPSVMFFLGSVGLGAALMYFCDPQSGPQRRALAQEQCRQTMRRIEAAQPVAGGGMIVALLGLLRGGVRGLALSALGSAICARAIGKQPVQTLH